MEPVTTLETVLRRDRAVVTVGLGGVAALGWVYLLYLARGMAGMDMSADMAMPQMETWGVVDLGLLFVMWAVMMVAMMVPSASPLILMMAAANRSVASVRTRWCRPVSFWRGICWAGRRSAPSPPSSNGGCTRRRCSHPAWSAPARCWAVCCFWPPGEGDHSPAASGDGVVSPVGQRIERRGNNPAHRRRRAEAEAVKVPYLLEPAIERDAEVLLAQFCGARGVELLAPIPVEEILEQHLGLSLGFDDLHARFDVPQMGEEPDVPGALFVDRREVLINQVLIRKIIQTERVNDDARRAIGTDKGAVDVGLSASVWRGPRAI